jgi:hypothetical protein
MRSKAVRLFRMFAIFAAMPLGIAAGLMAGAGPAHAESAEYCAYQARDYADRKTGAARTTARGGIIGGIIGGGDGAVRGATIGAVRGVLGTQERRWNRLYEQSYKRCMRS